MLTPLNLFPMLVKQAASKKLVVFKSVQDIPEGLVFEIVETNYKGLSTKKTKRECVCDFVKKDYNCANA